MFKKFQVTAIHLLALLLVTFSPAVVYGANLHGAEVAFEPAHMPGWTVSGVWNEDETELIVVDVLRSQLVRYSTEGKFIGAISIPGVSRPSMIQKASNGYILEEGDGHFIWLDLNFRPTGPQLNLTKAAKSGPLRVASAFSWTPDGQDEILSFSDLEATKGEWWSGYLRIPVSKPSNFQVLRRVAVDDNERTFHLLGYPGLAATSKTDVFLAIAEAPFFMLVDKDRDRKNFVRVTTAAHSGQAALPKLAGPSSFKEVFSALERRSIPEAIYAWRDSVYVLVRAAGREGQSKWSLARLNTATGQMGTAVELGLSAKHLTVIPGNKFWAFILKESVLGAGVQKIPSFMLVPASAIAKL